MQTRQSYEKQLCIEIHFPRVHGKALSSVRDVKLKLIRVRRSDGESVSATVHDIGLATYLVRSHCPRCSQEWASER